MDYPENPIDWSLAAHSPQSHKELDQLREPSII